MKKKICKKVKVHKYLVSACKYINFAQGKENFALLHNHENVTFRNSVPGMQSLKAIPFLLKSNAQLKHH